MCKICNKIIILTHKTLKENYVVLFKKPTNLEKIFCQFCSLKFDLSMDSHILVCEVILDIFNAYILCCDF